MLWKKEDLYEVDWVKEQTRLALADLKKEVLYTKNEAEVKFDVDTSLNYLKTLKDKKTYKEVMEKNPWATVMAVQILLKNKWYNIGKIDGILKTQTEATSNTMEAIKKFQRENWLPDDGAPGPDTIKKILAAYENWWWNAWAAKPKPKTPNNPKPVTPNKPKTPERQAQNTEATLADLKNFNPYSVWNFDKDGFVFKKWVEKSDSKWKYILVNGKKLYELGNNESGVHYDEYKSDDGSRTAIAFWEYKNLSKNWRWMVLYSDWEKYTGEWKNGQKEWKWIYYFKNWEKYAGEFKNGLFEWKWIEYYRNGNKHISGEWKDDKLWTWYVYDKDWKTILERWVNGKKEK